MLASSALLSRLRYIYIIYIHYEVEGMALDNRLLFYKGTGTTGDVDTNNNTCSVWWMIDIF